MRNIQGNLLFILIWTVVGFQVGEIAQLEQYFNGRATADFRKKADNLKLVLPPKTQGQILEIKNFQSGNSGIKIKVLNGPNKNAEVWVYYKTAQPEIHICKEIKSEKCHPAEKLEQAKSVQTKKRTVAVKDPDVSREEPTAKIVENFETLQKSVKEVGNPTCTNCEVATAGRELSAQHRVGDLISPKSDGNLAWVSGVWSSRHGDGIERCCNAQEDAAFKFCNNGPNSIVPHYESDIPCRRNWTVRFDNHARQDMHLWLQDSPDTKNSTTQDLVMMFFPRVTVPSVKVVGDEKIVTLSNGEVVVFDHKTNKVKSGVLSEDGPLGFHKSKVSYNGSGVVVRVDNQNPNNPRVGGTDPRIGKTATIQKGSKICKVPSKKLWPDQRDNSELHFGYKSDSEFNSFIQAECGFGLD